MEFKTLSKNDPEFLPHLLGSFSKTERALPVESLNINSGLETVTFKIIPVSDIHQPSPIKKWMQILKVKNFILLAFPIFCLTVKNSLDETNVRPFISLLNILSCLCLLIFMNLQNDYWDHLSGLDRLHPGSGSRAIQLGWVAAYEAKNYSWLFLFLAFSLGLPSLSTYPSVIPVTVVAFLLLLGSPFIHWLTGFKNSFIISKKIGFRFRRWTEVLVFLFFGPLFSTGFQVGGGHHVDLESFLIGIISGLSTLFVIHIRNFESIMVNNQAGFSNSVKILGFEKSKQLLWWWWVGIILVMGIHHSLFAHEAWMIGFFFISFGLSWNMLKTIRTIKSPVSSSFGLSLKRVYKLVLIITSIWIIENVSYLLINELDL